MAAPLLDAKGRPTTVPEPRDQDRLVEIAAGKILAGRPHPHDEVQLPVYLFLHLLRHYQGYALLRDVLAFGRDNALHSWPGNALNNVIVAPRVATVLHLLGDVPAPPAPEVPPATSPVVPEQQAMGDLPEGRVDMLLVRLGGDPG